MIMSDEKLILDTDDYQDLGSGAAGAKWDEIYTAFLDGVKEVTKLAGGKENVEFKVHKNNIQRIWPHFKNTN